MTIFYSSKYIPSNFLFNFSEQSYIYFHVVPILVFVLLLFNLGTNHDGRVSGWLFGKTNLIVTSTKQRVHYYYYYTVRCIENNNNSNGSRYHLTFCSPDTHIHHFVERIRISIADTNQSPILQIIPTGTSVWCRFCGLRYSIRLSALLIPIVTWRSFEWIQLRRKMSDSGNK